MREPRTAAATRARLRKQRKVKLQRAARLLRDHGYVIEHHSLDAMLDLIEVAPPRSFFNPCADGCSNTAAHAEGGHDV